MATNLPDVIKSAINDTRYNFIIKYRVNPKQVKFFYKF